MGSPSDPTSPPMGKSANNEVLFDDHDSFREDFLIIDGGLTKNANLSQVTAIPDEGKYKVVTGPQFLRKRKATPHASASTHNEDDKNSKVEMFFAQRFKELDLELKAKQVQVPLSVTEGNVAGLTMVVSAEGEPVFRSGLESMYVSSRSKWKQGHRIDTLHTYVALESRQPFSVRVHQFFADGM